jgi:hypothetical protein
MEAYFVLFLEHLGPIVFSVLGIVLIALIRAVLKKYAAKLELSTVESIEAFLIDLVAQGTT